jgi:N-succinyldiaminopimelate aminotransferase
MVLPVNGTREGLFSFVQAVLDPAEGGLVLMPNPFYQIYEGAALLAGAEPYYLDTTAATGFLPDLDAVPADVWRRCRILFICSPGNPTGAVMDEDYLQRVLELAARHDFVVAADECYADIYLDEHAPPPGLLGACLRAGNARFERCAVFHSLSKRSSVPGLRSGFVAGDASIMDGIPPVSHLPRLRRARRWCSSPAFPPWSDDAHAAVNRFRCTSRSSKPWCRSLPQVDAGGSARRRRSTSGSRPPCDDESFTRGLYAAENVTVLPGRYLSRDHAGGNPGRGRVRVSLVAELDECIEAARRIARFAASLAPPGVTPKESQA